ncbi:MAG: SAM-dependent methyltransferase [Chlorobi bacterium]|nr:SAM-dependent methyltransferase [Chlorobiota bacterium]
MRNKQINIFFEKLIFHIDNNEFIKLIISNKKDKTSSLKKVTVNPVLIKKGFRLSFVYAYDTKEITKNFTVEDAVGETENLLINHFLNAELFTLNEIIRLYLSEKNTAKLTTAEPVLKPVINLNHDRQKQKRIKTQDNLWLQKLSITNSEFAVKKNMYDKYRQINKYIEIIETNIINRTAKKHLSIVDAGSGKGYLTFALYDYFKNSLNLDVKITGIESRKELTDLCNNIADDVGFKDLKFEQGNIIDTEIKNTDIYIALHACDTATDEAIYKGIRAGADFIAVAPCCQKQIRKQLNPENALASLTKYGILKERQAVILTDGLRALLLESKGYKTKVFEFISTEHTPKNIIIIAEKSKKKSDVTEILKNIEEIKNLFGIKYHYLETLLNRLE